jgi:hypothetical protein
MKMVYRVDTEHPNTFLRYLKRMFAIGYSWDGSGDQTYDSSHTKNGRYLYADPKDKAVAWDSTSAGDSYFNGRQEELLTKKDFEKIVLRLKTEKDELQGILL